MKPKKCTRLWTMVIGTLATTVVAGVDTSDRDSCCLMLWNLRVCSPPWSAVSSPTHPGAEKNG